MDQEKIRILLVDDQKLFAEGLKYILESRSSDIEIAGIAFNGQEAIALANRLQPDIILMDVRMPVMDGVKATTEIHQRHKAIKIVMLTTFDDDEEVHAALHNGAIGYLLKNRPPLELINSIRAVQSGIMQLDPKIAESLFQKDSPRDFPPDVDFAEKMRDLTTRERDVLHLMAQAFDNKQIAVQINVAEQTVRNYIHSIYSKLGISSRNEIIRIMREIDF